MGILNVDGYYDSLLKFFDRGVEEGFIRSSARNNIVISANNATDLLQRMQVPFTSLFLLFWKTSNDITNESAFLCSCRTMYPSMIKWLQVKAGMQQISTSLLSSMIHPNEGGIFVFKPILILITGSLHSSQKQQITSVSKILSYKP